VEIVIAGIQEELTMQYSRDDTLKIFISHASEDNNLADVLAKTLRGTFANSIEIVMMSEFPMEMNWRQLIDKSINQTDILIAIATGRLKPTHSWTGLEIGSFTTSIGARKKMARRPPKSSRCSSYYLI
jgi:hypothetical protein